VALQRLTWGYADIEVTPQKSFMLAQELGGQVIGAFAPDGRLAGFAMSMAAFAPALDPATGQPAPGAAPQPYLHSHMLAVLPEYRDQGLGARLKLAQREDALDRGILRMTWTFDPLAAKNAHLNIHRLGAIARRYSPDFYGVSSSRLQAGLPTDRLHAEWWLASARVRARARAMSGAISGAPLANVGDPFAVCRTILLPRQVDEWKQEAAGFVLVEKLQRINREIFLKAFAQALVVTDFSRDASGNGVYGLAEWHPSLSKP
jgi:predicted GNAT superfamily acetyltransferase